MSLHMETAYFTISDWRCSCGQFNYNRDLEVVRNDKPCALECVRCHTFWMIKVEESKQAAEYRVECLVEKRKAG